MKKIDSQLRMIDSKTDLGNHVDRSIKISVIISICAYLAWILFSNLVLEGLAFSFFIFLFSLKFHLESAQRKIFTSARKIEKELPFALMQLSVELNIGVPMDKALDRIVNGDYAQLSKLLEQTYSRTIAKGGSLQDGLLQAGSKTTSQQFKRAVSHIISIYDHGTKKQPGEIIRQMALEGLLRQKAEAKEYAGKLAALSVAFIALSAVFPALFQAFVLVGSTFMEIDLSAEFVLLIIIVIFPAVDIALLLYIRSLAPEFMK